MKKSQPLRYKIFCLSGWIEKMSKKGKIRKPQGGIPCQKEDKTMRLRFRVEMIGDNGERGSMPVEIETGVPVAKITPLLPVISSI